MLLLAAAAGSPCLAHSAPECADHSVAVQVTFTPGIAAIDQTKPSRQLQKTGAYTMVHQLGLTLASSQRTVAVRMHEEGHCQRAIVSVYLRVDALVIELASELSALSCLRQHVLEHEMQHAAIYNAAGARAALQLEREMQTQLRLPRDPRDQSWVRDLHERGNGFWLARLDALLAEGNAEQQALDAVEPQEMYRACGIESAQFVRIAR